MVLGVLDVERRRFKYVNAGHNPPLVVFPDGAALQLRATGLPLGIMESAVYEAAEADLPAGTTCLFYTDGLVERADAADQFLGEERVLRTLSSVGRTSTAAQTLAAVVADADSFARGVEPADDVALLVVRSC
jgi:sigma-B regulation protein RsbU (phosphoserine phosphatase)